MAETKKDAISTKVEDFKKTKEEQDKQDIEVAKQVIKALSDYQLELDSEEKKVGIKRLREIVADITFSFAEIYKQIIRSKLHSKEEVDKIFGDLMKDDEYDGSKIPIIESMYL